MGEWRRGKWLRWLSATQKAAPAGNQELTSSATQPVLRTGKHQSQLSATASLGGNRNSRNHQLYGAASASLHGTSSLFRSETKPANGGDCLEGG